MVTSDQDKQRHYIGPMALMRLYGVSPDECEIYEPASWWTESCYLMAKERNAGLTHLRPRADGNYSLPASGGVA
ncbi:hypothetical protein BHR41_02400 [Aeromonas salmonicida subsp. salmonicida]|nr:hypothetical protein AXW79_01355 [Aeromonas salmonicida subsp. salmonicida]OKA78042.1 hypothetical protein BHR41_02400 [Aeromonas salmonicida subsp. salmonicida]